MDDYSDKLSDVQSPIDLFSTSFYDIHQRPTFSNFSPKMDAKDDDTSAKIKKEWQDGVRVPQEHGTCDFGPSQEKFDGQLIKVSNFEKWVKIPLVIVLF